MALTMDNKKFKMEPKAMTHNDKMPNVHDLLAQMDSDPQAHILATALPRLIASGIRAWNDDYFKTNFTLEERVAATLNAMAVEFQSHLPK